MYDWLLLCLVHRWRQWFCVGIQCLAAIHRCYACWQSSAANGSGHEWHTRWQFKPQFHCISTVRWSIGEAVTVCCEIPSLEYWKLLAGNDTSLIGVAIFAAVYQNSNDNDNNNIINVQINYHTSFNCVLFLQSFIDTDKDLDLCPFQCLLFIRCFSPWDSLGHKY